MLNLLNYTEVIQKLDFDMKANKISYLEQMTTAYGKAKAKVKISRNY